MKSEIDKMISGKPYKAFGEELFSERQYAKELVFEINSFLPDQPELRNQILLKLPGKMKS